MYSNVKFGRSLLAAIVLALFSCSSANANPPDSNVLNVGDKIPALKYDKWLKGTPITNYKKGRLYIFEFWATWCGPCRMAMPHLSEVAAKYKDKLTVVGIDIWENDENHHATNSPEKFVKMMGNNMAYNVATDTKDQWMGNHWMKAAGQEGIPCSFMVKDGIILWIGHPINLDSVIEVVNSGKYDPVAVRAEFKKKAAMQQEQEAAMHRVMDPIDSADKAQDWPKEFKLIDEGKKAAPELGGYLDFKRFMVLLEHYGEDTAMAFVKPWQATKPGYTLSTAAVIFQKKGLPKDTYLYGIELVKGSMASQPDGPAPFYQEMIASGYAAAGDYKNAVSTLKTALDGANAAIRDGKYKGIIGPDTIEKMEKELAEYKSQL
jgi:thiol-disulfide isomerase/thioredoxin